MRFYSKMSTGLVFLLLFFCLTEGMAKEKGARYFYHGDGMLSIYGGKKKLSNFSGRLIALLDYLQDQTTGGKGQIRIYSGTRSPEQNEKLRKEGKLAARASLHLEGMAVDFTLAGVNSKKLWEFVRGLNCCGVGYYNGEMVHVDVGPPRFWDQKTTKVFTDISSHNKQIYLTTEYDIYRPDETLNFRLVRVTEYPFGIRPKIVVLHEGRIVKKTELKTNGDCLLIQNREETQNFSLPLPEQLPVDSKLQLRLRFCQKPSVEMPDFILSNPFVIE